MENIIWIIIISALGSVIGSAIGVLKKPSKDFEVEAIAGATISSKAVVDIINKTVVQILEAR